MALFRNPNIEKKMLPRATPGAAWLSQPACFDGPSELYKPTNFQNSDGNQKIAELDCLF